MQCSCSRCRFVELLWQLSLHALREVHRRTFAADVASNPLPAPLTDVAFSHAATLLPVTKVIHFDLVYPILEVYNRWMPSPILFAPELGDNELLYWKICFFRISFAIYRIILRCCRENNMLFVNDHKLCSLALLTFI